MKTRIYYHHTDCGGVVYYATYLAFLEEARTEFLCGCGVDVGLLMSQGTYFVVSRQEIDYRSPAFYGDEVEVRTELTGLSAVRIELSFRILNQREKLIAEGKTVCVMVNKDFKPTAIPPDI